MERGCGHLGDGVRPQECSGMLWQWLCATGVPVEVSPSRCGSDGDIESQQGSHGLSLGPFRPQALVCPLDRCLGLPDVFLGNEGK